MTDIVVQQAPANKELQLTLKKSLAAIDRKIKKLGGDPNHVFTVPTSFKYNELDGNSINIHTCLDLAYLGKALAKMKRIEAEYNETMTSLGMTEYPVSTWMGTPTARWIADLTVLVKRLSNKQLVDNLTKKRQELSQFMSAEERLTNLLNELGPLMK